jgi:probable rRNA maturation factor
MSKLEVYAVGSDGSQKKVKAETLRFVLADGSEVQIMADGDMLLVGTPAGEHEPARLVVRPGAANAVRIAVEQDEAPLIEADLGEAMPEGSLDLAVQYVVKPKGVPPKKQFKRWTRAAMEAGLDASITLRVVDVEEGRALNCDYRGKDYATNVLSFAFNEGEQVPGMGDVVMGDLVLCAPVIENEAREQGKTLEAHWAHLVVHGVLHLQGYDHLDEVEAEAMEALETAILQGLGYDDPYASEKGAPDQE